jgi:hypothetical protein
MDAELDDLRQATFAAARYVLAWLINSDRRHDR